MHEHLAHSTGSVLTYEESGTSSRRAHSHNGYSSGFSPSRNQWREPDTQVRTERVDRKPCPAHGSCGR